MHWNQQRQQMWEHMREAMKGREGGRGFGGGGRHGFGRMGFGGHRGFDGGERMERMLGHGDLKYVILSFLAEQPRHGYEIIKLLEEKSGGHYTPSPGVIYPTLTLLEESGFATAETNGNKKLFTITEDGAKILAENIEQVNQILERFTAIGEKMSGRGGEGGSIRHILRNIHMELFAARGESEANKTQIAEILEKALAEIRKLKG